MPDSKNQSESASDASVLDALRSIYEITMPLDGDRS